MTITFSQPTKLNKVSAYNTKASNPYNLSQMGSDEFAKLIYWIYRTEIKEGKFSGDFDDIAIMKATKDAGRDCVLYKDGIMTGAIQCKHSINTMFISVDSFLAEFTKFILYSIKFPKKVNLGTGFSYYVASSGGFTEDTINLINDFEHQIISQPKLRKHAESNISEYASLKDFKYDEIEKQFLDSIALVKVQMITSDDINKLLHEPRHMSCEKAFFASKYFIDDETAKKLKERTKKIEKKVLAIDRKLSPKKKKRPQQIEKPEVHIPREVSTPDENIFDAFNEKQVSLVECILKFQYIAFLGWGLSGKSIEMRNAAHELSSKDYSYHVFLFSMGLYKGQDIDQMVTDLSFRPLSETLIFLDGLDEVQPEFYSSAILSIADFRVKYPKVRLIVSCRNNAYLQEENNAQSTLPDFTVITIKDLSQKSIIGYLETEKVDIEDFYRKLESTNLESLLATPFYLIKFTKRYMSSGKIYTKKGELFEETIEDGIKSDIVKYYLSDRTAKQIELRSALNKLAFVMEMRGKNFFTTEELNLVFADKQTVLLLTQNGKLIEGNALTGSWRFFHHNIQEYLAAKVLSKSGWLEIRNLITFEHNADLIRPGLVNTISFLIGLLPKHALVRKELVNLLGQNEPAIFMKFEADYLNDELREQMLRKIFEYYKSTQRPINIRRFALLDLAVFSQVKGNLDYLIDEFENYGSENDGANALDILTSYDYTDFPQQLSRLEDVIVEKLDTANDHMKFMMIRLLTNHVDYDSDSFRFIFECLKGHKDTNLRSILLWSIARFDLEHEYQTYIISQAEYLVLNDQTGVHHTSSNRISGTEFQMIDVCLKKMNDRDSIVLKTNLIKNYFEHFRHSISLSKVIPGVLLQGQDYPMDNEIIDPVIETYILGIKAFLIDPKPNDIWICFFRETNCLLQVCQRIISAFGGIVLNNSQALIHLCDMECINYLAAEVSNLRIPVDQAELFQWFLKTIDIELVETFNRAVNRHINLAMPVKVDSAKIFNDQFKMKLNCVFDFQYYRQQVNQLFANAKKDNISYMDLHSIKPSDYAISQYYYWLFELFDYKHGPGRNYSLQEVLDFENSRYIDLVPSRIYGLIKENPLLKLSQQQIDEIKNWCLSVEDNLDFEKEVYHSNYRIIQYSDEELFAYFVQRFDFAGFRAKTYLEMLLHYDGSGSSIKIYDFISSYVKRPQITRAILNDLSKKRVSGMVLLSHVEYVVKFQCRGAAESLIEYLRKDLYQWDKVLEAYLAIGGDHQKLYTLLPSVASHNLFHLVNKLIEGDVDKVRLYLKDLFENQAEDRKLLLTKYLIRLGDVDAFNFYLEIVKGSSKIPDILTIHSPIQINFNEPVARLCFELFEYTFTRRLQFDTMNNPFGIAINIFRSMAADHPNFQIFRSMIINYLSDLQSRQPKNFEAIRRSLESFLEDWDHNYMLNDTGVMSVDIALTHFKKINELD